MTRLGHLGGKLSLSGALSLGLIVAGVSLCAWAVVSIAVQPTSVADPIVSEPKSSRSSTESIAASETSGPPETTSAAPVHPATLKKGNIGVLVIPALKQSYPVFQGTSSAELKKGVGHMVQTAMPGEPDNCVISGHRDTVFTDLGKLKKKDRLIIETAKGTFTYRIRRIRIVHKDDRTVVVPTDRAVLTVSTCYPFRFVGSAPDRYVLVADLVTSQ